MSERMDAVVVLSGEFSPDLSWIGPGTQERMDTGIVIAKEQNVPMVLSGNYPFRWRTPPPHPLAHHMRDYALQEGVEESMVIIQDESLDTIGDAVFTKKQVAQPHKFKNFDLVTSNQHAPRSDHIFKHVMGPGYRINTVGSGPASEVRFQALQEMVGNILVQAVLNGTEPGDTEAIEARLFKIIPGYSDVQALRRILSLAAGITSR